MRMHIEYDDFGEYLEVLEEYPGAAGAKAECEAMIMTAGCHAAIVLRIVRKILIVAVAVAIMLCTTS